MNPYFLPILPDFGLFFGFHESLLVRIIYEASTVRM
jgi:hypothetical protein